MPLRAQPSGTSEKLKRTTEGVAKILKNPGRGVNYIIETLSEPLRESEVVINRRQVGPEAGKAPRICIVYLVSPRERTHKFGAGKNDEVSRMVVFHESLKSVKKFLPNYPIIVFHEDYTAADKKSVEKIVGKNRVKFSGVDFGKYKSVKNLGDWVNNGPGAVKGRPAGYRMMCRFFCGVMQNSPELANFDYYIRLDHDSFFIEPKNLGVEGCIEKYHFDYMFRSIFFDDKEKEALWGFTKRYAIKNNLQLDGFRKLKMLDSKGNYNGFAPYNNFHISTLSFWKRKDVKKYLTEIEKVDGIIKLHWQDANVHAMLLGLFNPVILEKTDFGYRHNFHYSLDKSLRVKYIDGGRNGDWP